MFKTAATKIAHNSTIPSIGGNRDLRPLQDLITAEKSVLISLQKLSLDFSKASEALRGWGVGEGDDLGDTLNASSMLLAHFSNALSQYATHEQSIRDLMKAIRTREEGLDELKRRRKSVVGKADSAERKLNKMSPEHKNLALQTDTLHRLRDEIRQLDTDIMMEEAGLSDFKRSSARSFMGLKFGGLQELSARGTIVGSFGKQIIAEIPEDVTQPGLSRNYYGGHGKTEFCVGEAQRYLNEVVFSGLPGQADPSSSRPTDYGPGGMVPSGPRNPGESPPEPTTYLPALPGPSFGGYFDTANSPPNLPQPIPQSQPIPYEPSQPSPAQVYAAASANRSVDDFGVGTSSMGGPLSPRLGVGFGGGSGRFATFPVKATSRPGVQLRDEAPPSIGHPHQREPSLSFSVQVAEALGSPGNTGYNNAGSQIRTDGFGGNVHLTDRAPGFDEPVPVYEAIASSDYSVPSVPSSPVAATTLVNPWNDGGGENNTGEARSRTSVDDSAEIHLAYMSSAEDLYHRAADRHVRFGATSDVDKEMEEKNKHNEEGSGREDEAATVTSRDAHEARTSNTIESEASSSPQNEQRPRRVPVPAIDDDMALNAAAAREISREMDSLTFSPPPMDRSLSPLIPPAPPFAQDASTVRANISTDSLPRSVSPPAMALTSPNNIPAAPGYPIQPVPRSSSLPPSQINVSDRSLPSLPSAGGTPYRTPDESPYRSPVLSNLSPSLASKSTSSLSSPQIPPGVRTISAAAFKRPTPRISSNTGSIGSVDTTPLSLKKPTLPSSPYPPRLQQPPVSYEPPAQNNKGAVPSSPVDNSHRRVPSSVPQNTFADEDDQFDYITAYVNNMGADESRNLGESDRRSSGQVNEPGSLSSGYGQGRFATNLEDSGLR